jgi:predicted NBD/HSP70 family sugar kinase
MHGNVQGGQSESFPARSSSSAVHDLRFTVQGILGKAARLVRRESSTMAGPGRGGRAGLGEVTLGIELSAFQKRIGALPVAVEPDKRDPNYEKRTRLSLPDVNVWKSLSASPSSDDPGIFAPDGQLSPSQTTEVIQFVNSYIQSNQIRVEDVVGVGVAIVASFAVPQGTANSTSASSLANQLSTNFRAAARVRVFNRSQIACAFDRVCGAASDLKNDDVVYITDSNSINFGVAQRDSNTGGLVWGAAGGLPHMLLDKGQLESLAVPVANRIGADIALDLPTAPCPVCKAVLCLTNIASCRAMALAAARAVAPGTPTKIVDMMRSRASGATSDVGGIALLRTAVQGTRSVDTRAVLEAAEDGDPTALQIVRQAGLALGLAVSRQAVPNFHPYVVILGGITGSSTKMLEMIREVASVERADKRHDPVAGDQVAINFVPTAFPGYTGLGGAAWGARAARDDDVPTA